MRTRRIMTWFGTGAALMVLTTTSARAEPLVADLSSHLITIASSYTGINRLLFGAVEEDGEVVVVIRGPAQPVIVRRKQRLAGVWVNRSWVRFDGVPGYYAVAATRPLAEFASETLLARHEIGVEHLRLEADKGREEAEAEPFRLAIARNMRRAALYPRELGKVTWLGSRLFRTEIHFPANVPVGNYTAVIYLIRDNEVISAQTTPLFIRKTGIERRIFEYAHRHAFWYGLFAVLLAITAGGLAGVIFRRI